MSVRGLHTPRGGISFPAFLPVTTFGGKFPLDEVVRPHLSRLAPALMVSHYYARQMTERPTIPLFVDSGGFASLFKGSEIIDDGNVAHIRTREGTVIHPAEVLDFQQKHADIGATLDFLIAPGLELEEAIRRQNLTIRNAIWACRHRTAGRVRLYASIQAWDSSSARKIMEELAGHPFDGFALGGMVPRVSEPESILAIVKAIRAVDNDRPLHVFGIGAPRMIRDLFANGVDTADSSSFVQYAADKKYLNPETGTFQKLDSLKEPGDTCQCRMCRTFSKSYYALQGELNTMALALHNLAALLLYLGHRGSTP